MPEYNPPVLDREIKIRNPEDEPEFETDDFGRPVDDAGQVIDEPDWGIQVWANKRDQTPFTEIGESVQIRAGRSVFTIRHREGVSPNSVIVDRFGLAPSQPDSDGTPFVLAGNPVERGGVNGGMFQRYLELHCERRSGRETAS